MDGPKYIIGQEVLALDPDAGHMFKVGKIAGVGFSKVSRVYIYEILIDSNIPIIVKERGVFFLDDLDDALTWLVERSDD